MMLISNHFRYNNDKTRKQIITDNDNNITTYTLLKLDKFNQEDDDIMKNNKKYQHTLLEISISSSSNSMNQIVVLMVT